MAALGSQSLARLGLTFPLDSLGVYPGIGPIPGKSTTLSGPRQPAGIFYASVAIQTNRPAIRQRRFGIGLCMALWSRRFSIDL